jgi:hypothetical protein
LSKGESLGEAQVLPDSSRKQSDDSREELRGLFVLGLIAVIATVRSVVGASYSISIGAISFNIVPILNLIIVTWSIYAFLVVLGLSVSHIFLSYARIFLVLGLIVTIMISALAAVLGYAPYSYYILALALTGFVVLIVPQRLMDLVRNLRQVRSDFKITLDFAVGVILYTVFLLLVLLALSNSPRVDYGQDLTVVGLLSILALAFVRLWRFISARRRVK